MGQCCVGKQQVENEDLASPFNKEGAEMNAVKCESKEESDLGEGLELEETEELEDAQTFYGHLERDRSATNSESSKGGVLSLLSLQQEAKDLMSKAISMYWTIKGSPSVGKEAVATASTRVKLLIGELSTFGVTLEKDQHPLDKSITIVQSWRLGHTPSTVSVEDSPVGKHTKESMSNAITTLPDTIGKIQYLIRYFANTYDFLR